MVRIGIVGAGWVAREHLKVMKVLADVTPVGIYSRTRAKADALAQEFGIEACYDTLDQLMSQAKPDALMLCVSENQMREVGLKALDFHVPLFFEKPAGLTPADNLILLKKAQANQIKTMVGFNRRYYSIFRQGLNIIHQHGQLRGLIIQGHERFWRDREGGKFAVDVLDNWVYANSTHTLDLLRFFGGEPEQIHVMKDSIHEKSGDQFSVSLKMDSGALAHYSSFWYSPGGWSVTLFGDGVTVEFKPLEKGVWIDKQFQSHDIKPDQMDIDFKPGFYAQLNAFAHLVKTGEGPWPLLDLQGAYQTMSIAERLMTHQEKK